MTQSQIDSLQVGNWVRHPNGTEAQISEVIPVGTEATGIRKHFRLVWTYGLSAVWWDLKDLELVS